MALTYPVTAGFLFSHNSLTALNGAAPWKGLTSVKPGVSIDGREVVFGTGPKGLGYPRGQLKVEPEFVFESTGFYLDWLEKYPGFLGVQLPSLSLVYEEGANRAEIVFVSLTLTGYDAPSEGTEAIKVTVPGKALDLLIGYNGNAPVSVLAGNSDDSVDRSVL
jgi:hypothetical protein